MSIGGLETEKNATAYKKQIKVMCRFGGPNAGGQAPKLPSLLEGSKRGAAGVQT